MNLGHIAKYISEAIRLANAKKARLSSLTPSNPQYNVDAKSS